MNWIHGLFRRVFADKASGVQISESVITAPLEPERADAPTALPLQPPPGEQTGRHYLQRSSRTKYDRCRLPLEHQNAIFFSGRNG